MKKLIFVLPFLAIAFLFSYCDRPNLQDELSSVNPDASANDRATCAVQIDKASPTAISLCGTNLNANMCISCVGNKAQGVTDIGAGVSTWNGNLTTPIEFYATSATGNSISITTVGPPVVVFIPAGGCKTIRIDASCGITAF